MRIYDENPTGYLPGEGCGVVVLMRTAQARAAGLPVYAEIVGWGTSAGGMPGVVASDASSQLLALRRAYERAGVDPCEVQLIEGHGSGLPAEDDAELIALTRAVGIPLAVLARDYQCTERTLLRRRQRAESALRNRLRAASGSL